MIVAQTPATTQTPATPQQTTPPPQNPPGGADDPRYKLAVNVELINVIATVLDESSKYMDGLKKEDFKIFEDARLQQTVSFSREAEMPLSIALLVDNSNSTAYQLKFERAAAESFFASIVKPGKDRALVIGFDSQAAILSDFTNSLETLSAGLKKMSAGGGTSVYDAIFLAAQNKLKSEGGDRRKVIVLISDGYDNNSRYSLAEALDMAQKTDSVIYAISTNKTAEAGVTDKKERDEGDKAIRQMVDETGGRAYFPKKLDDVTEEFQKIEAELRSQYVLAYSPQNPFDGTYRKIRVELADKKLVARTRAGFKASK